jgi:hypothetical protein
MSSRYDRPPWKPVNEKQFDVRLSATETARTLDKDYGKHFKIYTNKSKMEDKILGNSIVKEVHTIKKRILHQNTVFSTEQSAK